MSSLDPILPFLKPIEDLLRDPAITEVIVNEGGRRVFAEREGGIELVPGQTLESRNLTVAIKNIARACGDEISEIQPLLDARLEDGSRGRHVSAVCGDRTGPDHSEVRRRYSLDDLTIVGTLSSGVAAHLAEGIRTHQNVLRRLHVSLTDRALFAQPIKAAPGHHDIDSPARLDPVQGSPLRSDPIRGSRP
jgi:Flp pilus assembly CpaF family ATPase